MVWTLSTLSRLLLRLASAFPSFAVAVSALICIGLASACSPPAPYRGSSAISPPRNIVEHVALNRDGTVAALTFLYRRSDGFRHRSVKVIDTVSGRLIGDVYDDLYSLGGAAFHPISHKLFVAGICLSKGCGENHGQQSLFEVDLESGGASFRQMEIDEAKQKARTGLFFSADGAVLYFLSYSFADTNSFMPSHFTLKKLSLKTGKVSSVKIEEHDPVIFSGIGNASPVGPGRIAVAGVYVLGSQLISKIPGNASGGGYYLHIKDSRSGGMSGMRQIQNDPAVYRQSKAQLVAGSFGSERHFISIHGALYAVDQGEISKVADRTELVDSRVAERYRKGAMIYSISLSADEAKLFSVVRTRSDHGDVYSFSLMDVESGNIKIIGSTLDDW